MDRIVLAYLLIGIIVASLLWKTVKLASSKEFKDKIADVRWEVGSDITTPAVTAAIIVMYIFLVVAWPWFLGNLVYSRSKRIFKEGKEK